LATYDAVRAASLAALLAKNHTWQCPTLVWERGGNLLDVSDFSGDARIKYVPGPWKKKTWKRFTEEITQGYGTDDIATRKKFIEKELRSCACCTKRECLSLQERTRPRAFTYSPASVCTRNYSDSWQPGSRRWKRCKPP